jgi:hypothetical protein
VSVASSANPGGGVSLARPCRSTPPQEPRARASTSGRRRGARRKIYQEVGA